MPADNEPRIPIVYSQSLTNSYMKKADIAALAQPPSSANTASDFGLLGWSYDYASCATTGAPASGTGVAVKVFLRSACTISKIHAVFAAAGVTPTAGASNFGLYSASGTLLASVNIDADMTTGLKSFNITPQAMPAGYCYVGFSMAATTVPTMSRQVYTHLSISTLGGTTKDSISLGTGLTSLPSSFDPTTGANGTFYPWIGVS